MSLYEGIWPNKSVKKNSIRRTWLVTTTNTSKHNVLLNLSTNELSSQNLWPLEIRASFLFFLFFHPSKILTSFSYGWKEDNSYKLSSSNCCELMRSRFTKFPSIIHVLFVGLSLLTGPHVDHNELSKYERYIYLIYEQYFPFSFWEWPFANQHMSHYDHPDCPHGRYINKNVKHRRNIKINS